MFDVFMFRLFYVQYGFHLPFHYSLCKFQTKDTSDDCGLFLFVWFTILTVLKETSNWHLITHCLLKRQIPCQTPFRLRCVPPHPSSQMKACDRQVLGIGRFMLPFGCSQIFSSGKLRTYFPSMERV